MTLEHLGELRDNFSNEIPDEIVHGVTPGLSHGPGDPKVRRNWWQAVVGELSRLKSQGQIPPVLGEEVENFLTHYSSPDFKMQPLTTQEDITRANRLIDMILGR